MSNEHKRQRRRRAIKKISEDRRCSFKVAAHIYDVMPIKYQKRF